jgi:fatty acid desaturase
VFFLPSRLAILFLAWAFDYLPHSGLHHKPTEDKLKTTRNRVGAERLLSPVMLYQNYHLVHHLHPVVPFYRYIAVWRRNEDKYLEGEPALSTVGGREITPEEYRKMRELVHHH